jgi:hypothetical protein
MRWGSPGQSKAGARTSVGFWVKIEPQRKIAGMSAPSRNGDIRQDRQVSDRGGQIEINRIIFLDHVEAGGNGAPSAKAERTRAARMSDEPERLQVPNEPER